MLTNSPSAKVTSYRPFEPRPSRKPATANVLSFDRRSHIDEKVYVRSGHAVGLQGAAAGAIGPAVDIFPADIARRRAVTWDGMAAEVVQDTRRKASEYRFRAQRHLLTVYEQGVRTMAKRSSRACPDRHCETSNTSSLSFRPVTNITNGRTREC